MLSGFASVLMPTYFSKTTAVSLHTMCLFTFFFFPRDEIFEMILHYIIYLVARNKCPKIVEQCISYKFLELQICYQHVFTIGN